MKTIVKIKLGIVIIGMIIFSNLSVFSQTNIYTNGGTLRVACWSNTSETLDQDCNVNLNGDYDGNNMDTVVASANFIMEGGSNPELYISVVWNDYQYVGATHEINPLTDEGMWYVSKYCTYTQSRYYGYFWVRYGYELFSANFTVTNNGDRIGDAAITIDGETEYTNPFGLATFNDLDNGWYLYSITADGYLSYSSAFNINGSDKSIPVDLTLSFINESNTGVDIYPNPASDLVIIRGLSGEFEYKIFDLTGRVICKGVSEKEIDISMINQGLYTIELSQDEIKHSIKFVKD